MATHVHHPCLVSPLLLHPFISSSRSKRVYLCIVHIHVHEHSSLDSTLDTKKLQRLYTCMDVHVATCTLHQEKYICSVVIKNAKKFSMELSNTVCD